MNTALETTQEASMSVLSPQAAVTALNKSMILGRKALQTELAVCLAIYAGGGGTSREMRQLVTKMYCMAGYEAENPSSRHYKTINRRVSAAASLYEAIGGLAILHWIGNLPEDQIIDAVIRGLDAYQFESMDDVLEFTGRPSNRTHSGGRPKNSPHDVAAAATMKFNVGRLHVELPKDACAKDLMRMAAKLIRVARVKEQQELATPLGRISGVDTPKVMQNLH